ncbi:MAG: protein kinase [Methylococcaceae bacterium]|nr:protein kinase [Methylococcaceae bacterium]
MKVVLTVIKGPGIGQVREFLEPRGFIIGRAPDCDFQLPPNDHYVSRQHVYLEICPPACRMRDLGTEGAGSTNPPRLNGQPVTEADLKDGDVLELGYTEFRIGITPGKPEPLSRDCPECGRRIEFWPDEPVPERCSDCSSRSQRAAAGRQLLVKCFECGGDLSTRANSDGRAQELAEIAHYCCERCLPKGDASAGKTILSYRIVKKLGEGTMGTVFLVYQETTGRLWAFKQIKDLKDAEMNRRFERGMRLYKGLAHRNIVRCFETGLNAQGQPYLLTEYIGGGELGEAVDEGARLRPGVAAPIICGVLDGLEHLHARQIIHRDLKPSNILIDRKLLDEKGAVTRPLPIPKISDFDLAKCYGLAGGTRITKLNTAFGTLMYMPPEQVRNTATVKEPADLYAVGVVLYYLMTGRYSFDFPTPADIGEMRRQKPEDWKNPQEALRMIMKLQRIQHPFRIILNEEPKPIRQRDASIPEPLAAVVDRAVRKDPSQRFQTAAEFRDALRGAL